MLKREIDADDVESMTEQERKNTKEKRKSSTVNPSRTITKKLVFLVLTITCITEESKELSMYITKEELLQVLQSTSQYVLPPGVGRQRVSLIGSAPIPGFKNTVYNLLYVDCKFRNLSFAGVQYVCTKLNLLCNPLEILLDDLATQVDIVNVGFIKGEISDILFIYSAIARNLEYPSEISRVRQYFRACSQLFVDLEASL